jgi:hypothetical protein
VTIQRPQRFQDLASRQAERAGQEALEVARVVEAETRALAGRAERRVGEAIAPPGALGEVERSVRSHAGVTVGPIRPFTSRGP